MSDQKKRKKVPVRLIPRKHAGKIVAVWRILESVVKEHHPELTDAKIALAWHKGWNEDADGRVKLGSCSKASDLHRQMHEFDFVITLNENVVPNLKEDQVAAILDHELCHAAPLMDTDGEQKFDERGKPCWRVRRHEIEEFTDVVARHGIFTVGLERMAAAMEQARERPLLAVIDAVAVEEEEAEEAADESAAASGEGWNFDTDPDAWKSLPLEAAGINGKIGKFLAEAKIKTIGDLANRTAEQGTWWYREIAGVGEKAAEEVENRMVQFWKEHPEYTKAG